VCDVAVTGEELRFVAKNVSINNLIKNLLFVYHSLSDSKYSGKKGLNCYKEKKKEEEVFISFRSMNQIEIKSR